MVWPITGAQSYEGEKCKSMKAGQLGQLASVQEDCWRIAFALKTPFVKIGWFKLGRSSSPAY